MLRTDRSVLESQIVKQKQTKKQAFGKFRNSYLREGLGFFSRYLPPRMIPNNTVLQQVSS